MATNEEEIQRRLQQGPDQGPDKFASLQAALDAEPQGPGTAPEGAGFEGLRAALAAEPRGPGTAAELAPGDVEPAPAVAATTVAPPLPVPGRPNDFLRKVFTDEPGERLPITAEAARSLARIPGRGLEGLSGVAQAGVVLAEQPFGRKRETGRREQAVREAKLEGRGEDLPQLDIAAAAREAEPVGRAAFDFAMSALRATEDLGRESAEFFPISERGGTVDFTDPNFLVAGSVDAIGQLGIQILAATATGGGSGVAQFIAFALPTLALEGGLAYTQTRDRLFEETGDLRLAEQRAAGVALTTGAGAVLLERLPAGRFIFNKIPGAEKLFNARIAAALAGRGNFATGLITGALTESIEEVGQEVWSSVIQDIQVNNPDAWNDLPNRIKAAALFGAVGGVFGGGLEGFAGDGGPGPIDVEPDAGPDLDSRLLALSDRAKELAGETIPTEVETEAAIPEPTPPAEPAGFVERRFRSVRERIADIALPERRAQIEEQAGIIEKQASELKERFTDKKTQLQNPDAFEAARERIESDPEQELVMIDLVNFKGINDLVSREAGDDRLKEVAGVLKGLGIDERKLFRVGGDEFVVVTEPGRGEALGKLITERIGTQRVGDTEIFSASRFGVGQTEAEADAAAQLAKKAETGKKFRSAQQQADAAAAEARGEVAPEPVVEEAAPPAADVETVEGVDFEFRKALIVPTRGEKGGIEIRIQPVEGNPDLVQAVNVETGEAVGEPGIREVVEAEIPPQDRVEGPRSDEGVPVPPGAPVAGVERAPGQLRGFDQAPGPNDDIEVDAPLPVGEELEAARARARGVAPPPVAPTGPVLIAEAIAGDRTPADLAHFETAGETVRGEETLRVVTNMEPAAKSDDGLFRVVATDNAGKTRLIATVDGLTAQEVTLFTDTDAIPAGPQLAARIGEPDVEETVEAFRQAIFQVLPRGDRLALDRLLPPPATERAAVAGPSPRDIQRIQTSAVRRIFGIRDDFAQMDVLDLMTAIDEEFQNQSEIFLPSPAGEVAVFAQTGEFAHLRGKENKQKLTFEIPGTKPTFLSGEALLDLVRRSGTTSEVELEELGQLQLDVTPRQRGVQTRTHTDPVVSQEATAAEATAQREAEAEVSAILGNSIATPEQIAEIDRRAEEASDGPTELETATQRFADEESAPDLQGADVIGRLEPVPPGGRPGGRRDLQDDGLTTAAEEAGIDPGPDREDGPGSRAAGDRAGERPGDVGSRSAGRLSGLSLAITGKLVTDIGGGGPITKTRRNLAAIRILKDVEAQGRQATTSEQEELALYAGWGGIPQVFNPNSKKFGDFARELEALLTPEEFRSARESVVNAHFTSPEVIQEMHSSLERMGLPADAQLLEPSMGIGSFIGLGPQSYNWFGIELDSLTGRMARLIYPTHEVHQRGFEATPLPNGHFDAAVSNVPFGNFIVDDAQYRNLKFSIHNYFFAKALDKVRPGGVVAFITSRFTMDSKDSKVRKYLSDRADFIGAVRLPDTAFRKTSGTDVVTDVIYLRKRAEGETASALDNAEWLGLTEIQTDEGAASVNSYYARNPDQVVGRHTLTGSMRGAAELTVKAGEGVLRPQIAAAMSNLPQDIITKREAPVGAAIQIPDVAPAGAQEGAFRVVNGEIMQVREGRLQETKVFSTQKANVTDLIGLRDAARAVLQSQLAGDPDEAVQSLQVDLNRVYDRYVAKRGPINTEKITKSGTVLRPNYTPFRSDPDAPLVAALEIFDSENNTATKAPIFSDRVVPRNIEITEVEQPTDALPVSLGERGKVDVAYMAEIAGVDEDAIIGELRGRIYQDPTSKEWVTDDEYLSGNVREKLILARAAAQGDQALEQNVVALEKVQPEDLLPSQIDVSLGAPWVPAEVYSDFINEILELKGFQQVRIGHSVALGAFTIEAGGRVFGPKATVEFGTRRRTAVEIFASGLNQTPIIIKDKIGDKKVRNVEETLAAREKLQDMKELFSTWIWTRPDAEDLASEYNDRFNNTVVRKFDGSHLTPPGMSPEITLQPQQLDGAWRIISSGNTLLAHVVGAGKTFTMQVASMEEKRMGLINKPLHVVPNHMLEQYTREFLQLYPAARVLAAESKDLDRERRRTMLARIATGDWDAVVLTHAAFKRINVSRETRRNFIQGELDEVEEQIRESRQEKVGDTKIIKLLVAAQNRAKARMAKLLKQEEKDLGVTFEELGVDRIFLDEAHLFKNLRFITKLDGVSGDGSQRAEDLRMKLEHLEQVSPGRGVVFATATPIANSLSEVFTMMRYLQPALLEDRGLRHFDSWAAQFGETVTAAEIKPDGSGYRMKDRFARFRNIPELSQMFRQVWDVKRAEDLPLLETPAIRGGVPKVVISPASFELSNFVQELSKRADNISNVDPSEDNMLKITTEGRKAALDMRLITPVLDRDPEGKAVQAADEIFDIWEETADERLTQLVFIDFSAPKANGFHVYGEVKDLLLERGIPESDIAFMHDANTDIRKARLFQHVREGRIRILFGSTGKMGVGTNVQKRLIALHELDPPWRPADVEQRVGRIVRQGNDNSEVRLLRYVTEGSFDAYMWQGLERKQFFIEQIMTGDPTLRTLEDVGGSSLNAAETKALASGNPLAIEKASVDSDVARLQRQQRTHVDSQFRVTQAVAKLPAQIEASEQRLTDSQDDTKRRIPTAGEKFAIKVGSKEFTDRKKAGTALVAAIADYINTGFGVRAIGEFAGFDLELSPPGFAETADRPTIHLKGNLVYQVNIGDLTPVGLLRRLEALAERIPKQARIAETKLKNLRTELKQSEDLAGQPFARAEELGTMIKRQDEINAELNLSGRQQDVQISRDDDAIGEIVYGENGLTEAELEERDDSGFLDIRPLFELRKTRDNLITSDFADIEARYTEAKGIKPPPLFDRAKTAFVNFKNAFQRSFPEIDPDESNTMALNQDILRQFNASRDWSKAMAYHEIRKVTDGLRDDQVDLVTRLMILPDIQKDVEEGLYDDRDELPFGYDVDRLAQDLAKFQLAAEADEAVTDALNRRGEINRSLTRQLVDAELLPVGVLDDDRYYHRQVLKYFSNLDLNVVGVGGKDVRLRTKGFQKGRIGGGDFNTAYQEAEMEWMSQGFEMLARVQILERLQQLNDIKGDMKGVAKSLNETEALLTWAEMQGALPGDPIDDPFLVYKQRIAFSNAALATMASNGELTSVGGRFNDLIQQLNQGYDGWRLEQTAADSETRTPFVFQHPGWFGFLSHLLDNNLPGAMQAGTIFKAIRAREALTKELAGKKYLDPANIEDLKKLAPEGYIDWQPKRGTHLFLGLTIEERILDAALSGERDLTREDIREQLIVGGPKEQWLIPGNLARTMDSIAPEGDSNVVDKYWRAAQIMWKQWILLNPIRAARYNLNNMSGDIDIAFAYDPKIVAGGFRAAIDMAKFVRGTASEELSTEILGWQRLGVLGSGFSVTEIHDITDVGAFRFLTTGKFNPGKAVVTRYWSGVKTFTNWRENILRLSAARFFDAKVRAEGGNSIYAASRKTEIDAVTDPKQKAAKLSRELIGDYGAISKGGVWMRARTMPFYSWMEINTPRYYRLLKNTKHEGQTKGRGRRASALAVKKGSTLLLKMNVLFLAANLYNHLFFPEEEEELQRGRRQLHLILGRYPDGRIRSLRLEGAYSDALEWFNLQDYPADIADLLTGRKDIQEQGAEFVKAPIERMVNSWEPFTKTMFETAMKRSTYPTIFQEGKSFETRTRPIRDRGQHVSRIFSLDRLYNRVTGKPRRPSNNLLDDFLGTVLLYSTDPGEASFWQTRDMVSDFLEDAGHLRADIAPTRRSTALYYWKQSIKWGDEKAAVKWEGVYRDLNGTDQGMRQSLRLSAPLGGIAISQQAEFLASLTPRERVIVESAEEWFFNIFDEVTPPAKLGRRRRVTRQQRSR